MPGGTTFNQVDTLRGLVALHSFETAKALAKQP